jgi:hypothetical protein
MAVFSSGIVCATIKELDFGVLQEGFYYTSKIKISMGSIGAPPSRFRVKIEGDTSCLRVCENSAGRIADGVSIHVIFECIARNLGYFENIVRIKSEVGSLASND